jgi:hypothetical protein
MRRAPSIKRYLQRVERGQTIKGVRIAFSSETAVDLRADCWGPVNHVKDAFTFRQYLVKVVYAQKAFVVSIKNTEASNAEEAVDMAAQRANLSYLEVGASLGNLMAFDVSEDTPENREKLGVGGVEDRIEYESGWRNAA